MTWLTRFCLVQLITYASCFDTSSNKCDPEIHKLWYAVPNNKNAFLFCHPIKRIFLKEDCLFEGGLRKEFVPALQQCLLKNNTVISSTRDPVRRHPMYSRYGTFAGLKTINQQLILTKESTHKQPTQQRLITPELTKCPMGRVALRQENSNEPVICIAKPDQDIPGVTECGESREFVCTFATATSRNGICCQRAANSDMKCPLQMRPIINADGMVRPCSPTRVGLCRNAGSICVFDENYGDFHCCESEPPPKQWGTDRLIDVRTTTSISVLFIKESSALHSRKQSFKWYSETLDGCPKGEVVFRDHLTNKTILCDPTRENICPLGFKCHASQTTKKSQCCGYNRGQCPENSSALTVTKFGVTTSVVSCGPLGCPNSYFCFVPSYTCCTMEPITNAKCKYGIPLALSEGRSKRCTNTSCPIGYSCDRQFCCPTAELICLHPLDEGYRCSSSQPRRYFYYHQITGECRQFTYTGCSDNPHYNQNRFNSQEECENLCNFTNICPNGEMPLRQVNGEFINCTQHNDCPNHFNCLATFRGNYCCQISEPTNVCGENSKPYILRQRPVKCRSDEDCMPPFECFRNESYMIGYCCSKTRQAIFIEPKSVVSKSDCINGSPPLKTPNGEIQICVPNKQFECPVDYSCELNSYYGRYQCCQNQAASETNALQCPEGTSVQIHPVSGKPQKCNDDADCANFAQCQKLGNFCCEANDLKTLLRISQRTQIEPSLLSGLLPGQIGCIADHQCSINYPQSRCIDWICHCPDGMFVYELTCVNNCPPTHKESDGFCVMK